MGGTAFQEKLQLTKDSGLKTVIYDEAGDFSRRGAITSFNQQLSRVFQTFRTFKILIILCLPCFYILDNNLFLQGVPKLLLNTYGRNSSYGKIRGYGYEKMLYLRHKLEKEVVYQKAYGKIATNLRGQFLNLPPEVAEKLDKLSTGYKDEFLSTSILKNNGLLNYRAIAKELNRSVHWVKTKVNEHNIKPDKTYKRTLYYDNSILNKLEEFKGDRGRPKR
jgi:hypothetical protein